MGIRLDNRGDVLRVSPPLVTLKGVLLYDQFRMLIWNRPGANLDNKVLGTQRELGNYLVALQADCLTLTHLIGIESVAIDLPEPTGQYAPEMAFLGYLHHISLAAIKSGQ